MMIDTLELETPYRKPSQRETPQKADHKHEYYQITTRMRIRRFNGTITTEKYLFVLPIQCIDCGHTSRRHSMDVVEVEVDPKEFRRLREEWQSK